MLALLVAVLIGSVYGAMRLRTGEPPARAVTAEPSPVSSQPPTPASPVPAPRLAGNGPGASPGSAPAGPVPPGPATPSASGSPAPSSVPGRAPPAAEPTGTAAAGPVPPSFDVVRVAPDGSAVLAGRAAPGAIVTVTNGTLRIGEATADASGTWVMLPAARLPAGPSALTLSERMPDGRSIVSDAPVLLVVPDRPAPAVSAGAPPGSPPAGAPAPGTPAAGPPTALAILVPPAAPSRILQAPDQQLAHAPGATQGPDTGATPARPPGATPSHASAPPPPVPTAAGPDATALMRAFLEGCGLNPPDLPGADPEAAMRAAGALFRAFVGGTRDVLMSRAEIKHEMRVDQTMLRSRDNNALKFSISPDEAVLALLRPDRPGYKAPMASVEEAFDDIRLHEMAVMAGMQTGLIALMKRFDPAALEGRLQRGMLDGILPGARKARFWEAFCATYKDIAREAEDDFHAVFGRDFAKAYNAQIGKK